MILDSVAITEPRAFRLRGCRPETRRVGAATLNLQYCKIVAPVDGLVNKNVEAGRYVQPGENRDHQLRIGMSVIPTVRVR